MVKADDSNGGTDTIAVTINVDNATEKPLKPARPVIFGEYYEPCARPGRPYLRGAP